MTDGGRARQAALAAHAAPGEYGELGPVVPRAAVDAANAERLGAIRVAHYEAVAVQGSTREVTSVADAAPYQALWDCR